jgi:putative transposase
MYHFVWIPKYRHKIFVEPYREAMKAIIHMVIKGEPKVAPSHVMQVIKSISAREFFKLCPEVRKRYFWGSKL